MASDATRNEICTDSTDNYEDFEESSDLVDVENSVLVLIEKRGKDFFLQEENLKKLLTNNEVRNINVCVISIAGVMRMGKSFLLNLILLYFEREGWKTDSDDWLKKSSDEILNSHFSWSNGAPGHTQGIIAWSKPIIVEKDDGTKDLVFLVRDWDFRDHDCGIEGGKDYLKSIKITLETDSESIVTYLEKAFEKIDCYLMPSPSESVRHADITDKLLIKEMGEKFTEHVVKFIQEFLNPEKLKMKTIGFSAQVTGENLFQYIIVSADKVLSQDGPKMLTEMRALAEYNNNICKEQVIDEYRQHLSERVATIETWDEYEQVLTEAKATAKRRFLGEVWFGNFESSRETCLDPSFDKVEAYTDLRMRQRRSHIILDTLGEWFTRSIEEVGKARFKLKKYDKYIEATVSVDESRDPSSVIDLRKDVIDRFKHIYEYKKKICMWRGASSLLTACAIGGAVILSEPLLIPLAIVGYISTSASFLVFR